jgi:ABC-type nitrate/sulfonate/bicarbonate transport system substrate-binding protein/outer membrane protein OmpA-like peptidoglycan-associated protein
MPVKFSLRPAWACAALLAWATMPALRAAPVEYLEPAKPYKDSAFLRGVKMQPVNLASGTLRVPLITWAADGVTMSANGGLAANPNSALARAVQMPVQLELVDDFDEQVKNYVAGKTPFLRGTVGMIALAGEALANIDKGLEPVVIIQLSWSTGADGFVAKGISSLAELKGKTIVLQQNGPHVDLVQVLLQDAGLKPEDVTLKFVRDITVNPKVKDGKVHDPANALRNDAGLTAAACISPDILSLTGGGGVGTGAEDSVKGARPILTTRTANRVIADVYAVRRDFFESHRGLVQAFVAAHLTEQKRFQDSLANIARKAQADAPKVAEFKKLAKPLAGLFLQDQNAVNDYILWAGVDSQLAGLTGNAEFFLTPGNPVGFEATQGRILAYYQQTGLVTQTHKLAFAGWDFSKDFGTVRKAEEPAPKKFASTQEVRRAAESKDASKLFSFTFKFPAKMAEIRWQDYREVFETLNEKVSRYGGAVVQLRGHADNFFYNFVAMKRAKGDTTYQRRIEGSTQFETLPLPSAEEVANAANKLSYSRAFAVKQAYAQYLREALGKTPEEIDLSRFDVKGMGISDPMIKNPTTPQEREDNMRGEMVIIAAEAEVPVSFGADDLK